MKNAADDKGTNITKKKTIPKMPHVKSPIVVT